MRSLTDPGTVSSHIAALTAGVLNTMRISQVKFMTVALLLGGIVLIGGGTGLGYLLGNRAPSGPLTDARSGDVPPEQVGPLPKPLATPMTDDDKIQGTWTITNADSLQQGVQWTFKNGKLDGFGQPNEQVNTWYKLDPQLNPRGIDLTVQVGWDGPVLIRKQGIYQLDENVLKVAFSPDGQARSKAFSAGVLGAVLILKRESTANPVARQAAPRDSTNTWSRSVNGLQARITLIEKGKINGTRSLIPYLELRNSGNSAYPLKVRCGGGHVKFELVDADGKVVGSGYTLPRSGPHPDPGTTSLPVDSSMRINMHCTNWGVPKDTAAMISTDSGAWVLKPEQKGNVFLRATIKGEKPGDESDRTWHGTIETPRVKVDWSRPKKRDDPPQEKEEADHNEVALRHLVDNSDVIVVGKIVMRLGSHEERGHKESRNPGKRD
jgi:uncharacterized protein (TIGR03067 family)